MLTEKQAWEHLRDGFSKPEPFPESVGESACCCRTRKELSCCICDAISDMMHNAMISTMIHSLMLKKIKRYGPEHQTTDPYNQIFWPLSPEGAAQRVKFCELMLKEFQ